MKRIAEIDFFRGLFLIVITIDHLISNDNIIMRFTKERIGWMSGAEGFVLLSGFTAGLVYTHNYRTKGENFIFKAARKRSWTIYKYHICLLLLMFVFLSTLKYVFNYWGYDYRFLVENSLLGILLGIFLFYQPRILDILPLYAILIVFVPIVIRAFNKATSRILIIFSVAVYFLSTLWASAAIDKKLFWIRDYDSGFNILCWQLLLFIGVLLGYLFYLRKLRAIAQQKTLFAFCFFICVALFVTKNFKLNLNSIDLSYWTDRRSLRPLRLLNVGCLTFCMAYIVTKKRSWFQFKPVCYLGKYSLEVFSFHVLLVLLITPLRDLLSQASIINLNASFYIYPLETLVLLTVLLLLFLAPVLFRKVKLKDLKKEIFHKS